MARALSNGKILFSALFDGIVLSSRKFSSSVVAFSGKEMLKEKTVLITEMTKSGSATADAASAQMNWIPDPVTGYYRPANHLRDIDPAEQRQMFLNNKE
ncbi:late embryogenesis abundant protein Lea5-like [Phalaenopsis equestris]|uniref:late embryogenesis abundant protein Lea5-like n=1 Tax=Phalaenopsis equestris TaxID=78828 RepID=UPI0009E48F0B|nr:late embryogenesis abundant protein Lea5-like [Phalaenopsis equestris]